MARRLDALLSSPASKTAVFVGTTIVSGILCGTLVTEITVDGKLQWAQLLSAYSFYGLLVLSVLFYAFNKAVYVREVNILRFADNEFCLAYIRSQCLPEAAERYKLLIRSGEGTGDLERAMAEMKRILG